MPPKKEFWTEELDFKLIDEVCALPILWDIKNPQYSRNDMKADRWNEIAERLGAPITGTIARDRFTNMKTTFQQNQRRVKESMRSGAGTDNIYKPKWNLFEKLQFLKKVFAQAASMSNIDISIPNATWQTEPSQQTSNVYFDEDLQVFQLIPPDIDNDSKSSCTEFQSESESTQSSEKSVVSPSPVSPCPTVSPADLMVSSTFGPVPSTSTGNTCTTHQFRAPNRISGKRPDDNFYTKRGLKRNNKGNDVSMKTQLLQAAVDTMTEVKKQEVVPQDSIQIFGDYVVARLREMSEKDRKRVRLAFWEALESTDSGDSAV